MKVELTKQDLISLVKGIEPYYSVFDNPIVKKCGSYAGGFSSGWDWDEYRLEELTENELWDLYILCRDSWGDDDE